MKATYERTPLTDAELRKAQACARGDKAIKNGCKGPGVLGLCPDDCDCDELQRLSANVKEEMKKNEIQRHDKVWNRVEELVTAYAAINYLGFLTVWGMLADKADEGDGHLYDMVLTGHKSLYTAVLELGWSTRLLKTARELFIKQEGC
jgi:hypothetical protein